MNRPPPASEIDRNARRGLYFGLAAYERSELPAAEASE